MRRVSAKALWVEGQLAPTVEAEELVQAEKQLGFPLPPVLARLYCEVANGGFGPDYQFFPLVGAGRTAVSVYLEERSMSLSCDAASWPAGVLPILDWGCGMYAAVDCQSSEGAVLLFEPNAIVGDDRHLAWFVDSECLIDWLETWLSGGGWYEEDADGGDHMQPWELARARLSQGG